MNSLDFEIFQNWNNSLQTNDKMQFRTIQAKVKTYLDEHTFSSEEIEEILLAEGFKHNLIKEALSLDNKSEPTVTKEATAPEFTGMPKKYADLAPRFEKILISKGPDYFVKTLIGGTSPLMKLSHKEVEAFQRIADLAYSNPVYLNTLHSYMQPSISSELAENVCKARSMRTKCSVSENENGSFRISHKGKIIEASVKPMKSSSEKFVNSNYSVFNFPDEYIVLAYESSSPYAKIQNELS